MATVAINPANKAELLLDTKDGKFTFTPEGKIFSTGANPTEVIADKAKLIGELDEAFATKVAGSAPIAFEEVDVTRNIISQLGEVAPTKTKAMLSAAEEASAIYKAGEGKVDAAGIKKLGTILGLTPEAEKLLSFEADKAHLADDVVKGKISAFAKRVSGAHVELDKLTTGTPTRAEMLTAIEKHGVEAVETLDSKILGAHFDGTERIRGSKVEPGVPYTVSELVEETKVKAGKLGETTKELYDTIVAKSTIAEGRGSKAIAAKAEIKTAVEQLNGLKKDNPNFTHVFAEQLEKHPGAEAIKKAEGLKDFVSSVAKATDAAEKGPGFWAKQFKVTEEFKAGKLKAAEGNADKLAKAEKLVLGDVRKMKVGLVIAGAAAVTYAAFAALGRKPEGKYTQMVAANDQQPQQGAARA